MTCSPFLATPGSILVPIPVTYCQQSCPTCPTVTRAPRSDATDAPEKSFFGPSVDRQIWISTVLCHHSDSITPGASSTPSLCVPSPSHSSHCVKHTIPNRLKEQGVLQSSVTSSLPLLILCSTCSTLLRFSVAASSGFPPRMCRLQALPDFAQPLSQPADAEMPDPELPWTPPAPRASPSPSPCPGGERELAG